MRGRPDIADSSPQRDRLGDAAPFVLTAAAVALAWQIVAQPIAQRAPVELAVRIAPGSPSVLSRAAEAELAANRADNAASLARDALVRSPFDVRALRVVGLAEARAGRSAHANELLTLAGNWSLRDDPAHAWLVEYRLRRGDYASAFAHADTLARRRVDIFPQVFRLFTAASIVDTGRALPVVAHLLAADPPWRSAYLNSLYETTDGMRVAVGLALQLKGSRSPLTNPELQQLYVSLLEKGQVEAVKVVRTGLNPRSNIAVTNGSFDNPTAPEPFQWGLIQQAGAAAAITADEIADRGPAVRVEYDGYSSAILARQHTVLAPGRYRFRAESRTESGEANNRMAWTVSCALDGRNLLSLSAVPVKGASEWVPTTGEFTVPASCGSQWLSLDGRPLDFRSSMVVWFDNVSISPLDRTGSSGASREQ